MPVLDGVIRPAVAGGEDMVYDLETCTHMLVAYMYTH